MSQKPVEAMCVLTSSTHKQLQSLSYYGQWHMQCNNVYKYTCNLINHIFSYILKIKSKVKLRLRISLSSYFKWRIDIRIAKTTTNGHFKFQLEFANESSNHCVHHYFQYLLFLATISLLSITNILNWLFSPYLVNIDH